MWSSSKSFFANWKFLLTPRKKQQAVQYLQHVCLGQLQLKTSQISTRFSKLTRYISCRFIHRICRKTDIFLKAVVSRESIFDAFIMLSFTCCPSVSSFIFVAIMCDIIRLKLLLHLLCRKSGYILLPLQFTFHFPQCIFSWLSFENTKFLQSFVTAA
jgi:hypothetical protein